MTPISPRRNALVVVVLTATLVLAQYNIAKLPIRPFNLDPCDAVAHLAIFVIGFVLVISLSRALLSNGPTSSRYIVRLQQTFVLAVSIMVLADVVDLARHPSVWIMSEARNKVLTWVAVYVAVAGSMQSLIHATRVNAVGLTSGRRRLATLVFSGAGLILLVCPEYGIQHTSETAHILTVSVGVLIVLISIRVLLLVLLPSRPAQGRNQEPLFFRTYVEWGSVVIGVAVFAFAFWGQFHEVRVFHFRSTAISGIVGAELMIYGFLGKPLGLIRDSGGPRRLANFAHHF